MPGIRFVALSLALAASVALFAAVGWPASDYRHNDFFQFWAGPHAFFEGALPYDLDWWVGFHERNGSRAIYAPPLSPTGPPAWTSGYPLWTHVVLVPLALLPFELAAPLWMVLQVLAMALGVSVLRRFALRTLPARDGLLLAGLALAYQPAWLVPGAGNVTGFLFGLLAGSFGAALSGRASLSGALAALLMVKPHPFVLTLPAFLAGFPLSRLRFLAGAGLVAIPLVMLSFLLRPAWVPAWLTNAGGLQASAGSNATGWTLDRALPLLPDRLVPFAAVALVVVAWLWWIRARRPDFALLLAGTIPISLFVAPHGWSYDQLHLLITIAVILERLAALEAGPRLAGLLAVFVVAGPLPWVLYVIAFSRNGEEWSAFTPLLLFAILLTTDALAGAERRVMRPSLA